MVVLFLINHRHSIIRRRNQGRVYEKASGEVSYFLKYSYLCDKKQYIMRRILFIIFLLSIGMAGHAQEAKLDSASYAYGDKIIRSVVESKDSIIPEFKFDKENLAEVIRGLEDNLVFMKYTQDSIKKISFGVGGMQGMFMWDGFQFKMDVIPFDCILAGLMKVVNHEVALPHDTIMINEYMKSLPENMKPETMPDEDRCKFFTNYGTMKGLQPGLQGYIYEMTGKNENEAPADYEAYAAGLAMAVKYMSLEAKQESGQDPYSYGGVIGGSIAMQSLPFHFTEADFLDGCRAAAGLNERKITAEESDRIISKVFPEIESPTIIQKLE